MKYTVDIPMKLPSANDYILACRTNKFKAAKMKSDVEQHLLYYLREMPRFDNPVKIKFTWVEGNKRRDLDNVAFAKKFVLDAMVKGKNLKDDNRKNVTCFTDDFQYGKEFKVILEVSDE